MRSLRSRLLFSTTMVLVTFLSITGVLLDRAFQDSAFSSVEDRLRGDIFLLIGAADFDQSEPDDFVGGLPDPSLSTPGSGHYAKILDANLTTLWRSRSLIGRTLNHHRNVETGEWDTSLLEQDAEDRMYAMSYGILWEGDGEQAPRRYIIQAFEPAQLFDDTVQQFRRSLWGWFAGLSIALLVAQGISLTLGLRPLTEVGDEVHAIERGAQAQIGGQYPQELNTLTSNLNRLLLHNRASLKRYRNSLGDLAHSIKTPLAVLQNNLAGSNDRRKNVTAREQIERIDRTVQYYLERSAAAGRAIMSPPVALRPLADRIVASLEKVYVERAISISNQIPVELTVSAEEGDLMEIVGNLADNACKWAATRVVLSAAFIPANADQAACIEIAVVDDGPGIPPDRVESILQRGTRLDESVAGHGIGLAIVREMVEDVFDGHLQIDSNTNGTRVTARLSTV